MTRSARAGDGAAVVVHWRSGPAVPRSSPSDAPPAGLDGLRLDKARILEEILKNPPDSRIGVIPGTVGVADVAVAQNHGRDAVVVRFPAASGWCVQAFLHRLAPGGT